MKTVWMHTPQRSPRARCAFRVGLLLALLGLGLLGAVPDAYADEATPEGEVEAPEGKAPEGKAAAVKPMARLYLWVVDTQPRIFLCGTIHLSDPRVLAQPATVAKALEASQLVLTELDMRNPDLTAAGRLMRLPAGHTLSRMLPKKLYDRTAAVLAKSGGDLAKLDHLKIWALTFRLQFTETAAKTSSDGADTEPDAEPEANGPESMDAALFAQAAAAGKRVDGIETMREQLCIFDQLSLNEQIGMLESSVEAIENAAVGKPSSLDKLLDLYLAGDEVALYRFLCADVDPYDSGSCSFMSKILDTRNARMIDRLFRRRRAHPQDTVFLAVGAGHFPGRNGLLARLRRRGFRVRRVESVPELAYQAPPVSAPATFVSPRRSRFIPYTPPRRARFLPYTSQRVRNRARRPRGWFPFFGNPRCR